MFSFDRLRRKIENALWEWRLGITTRGTHVAEYSNDEHIFYGTNSYATTRKVLQSLALKEDDTFVDLGSGKGRVVCLASLSRVAQVIGVDDAQDMCALARENAARMKGRLSSITILQTQAQNFDYFSGTVFYMFNPFGPKTLKVILERMKVGVTTHPRTIRIVYATPANEELLRQSGWLFEYERWTSATHPGIDDTISFWTNR